jgi:anti-sigma factor RsiW
VISCDEALEAAALQAAGDIDTVTRERLETHLIACAACGAETGRIRTALDLLRAGEAPNPGADYWRSFDARLRGRILRERSVRRWRGVAGLAAAAAVAVVGLRVWTAGPRDAPASATPGGASVARPDESPDAAEARLEEAIDRLALQDEGERSFETVLDEVLPGNSPGYDADLDRPEIEAPQTQDNI